MFVVVTKWHRHGNDDSLAEIPEWYSVCLIDLVYIPDLRAVHQINGTKLKRVSSETEKHQRPI